MPRFVLLMYAPDPGRARARELWRQSIEAHGRFAAAAAGLGATLVDGFALESAEAAVSVRDGQRRDGTYGTDGEVVVGYYVVEADDLDHAVEIARLCPVGSGGVEVRPVLDQDPAFRG